METAVREVREETGLDVTVERLTGVYYDREVDNHHFMFLCAAPALSARPSCAEVSACAFWRHDSLPRPISDFTVRRIADALSGESPPLPVVVGPREWLD